MWCWKGFRAARMKGKHTHTHCVFVPYHAVTVWETEETLSGGKLWEGELLSCLCARSPPPVKETPLGGKKNTIPLCLDVTHIKSCVSFSIKFKPLVITVLKDNTSCNRRVFSSLYYFVFRIITIKKNTKIFLYKTAHCNSARAFTHNWNLVMLTKYSFLKQSN